LRLDQGDRNEIAQGIAKGKIHMNEKEDRAFAKEVVLWGGLECTVNRVANQYFSQMDRNGHAYRIGDLERFASLGIRAIRYPVLWEHMAPDGLDQADWSWSDARLPELRARGITSIVGLVHHGSGPMHTNLTDPGFAGQLAAFAGAVAQRYPWVEYYTPINEPLTTARFSGLYGLWYPHGRDERTFIQALLNQCRAIVLSMRAIRQINPHAKLVQTDDLGKTYSTPEMFELASFYNTRRWLAWDLLCGKVGQEHPLWEYLTSTGINPSEFLWFKENSCPPAIIGINYYITSDRWLDQRVERYPAHCISTYRGYRFADIEPVRVLATSMPGVGPLLEEAWKRYRLPLAITEAHLGAGREDQMRWLLEIWQAARQARQQGVDIRAVTVWALLGSYDWNCLVTECRGYYEPGPFDVRSLTPRATAVATLMQELAAGRAPSHPVLKGQGWWRRAGRFTCKPVASRTAVASLHARYNGTRNGAMQPLLIAGATGTLGRAFAKICEQRNLACKLLSRDEMDIAIRSSVMGAVNRHQPWAVVNASGYVHVDNAESDVSRCFRENAIGPSVLADICAAHGIQLLTFSSDLVFDGRQQSPYLESDKVAPLNNYGRSKAEAERMVLDQCPEALIVRTSAFFGPWDTYNFVTLALEALAQGNPFSASRDVTVSPTYVPDLVDACLDLLIDREAGIWHLTNGEPLTWADFALKIASKACIDPSSLNALSREEMGFLAPRPAYSALASERGILLPTLEDAMDRYIESRRQEIASDYSGMASVTGRNRSTAS
jgi:dTDP-4-dehydrorhamnose reductase